MFGGQPNAPEGGLPAARVRQQFAGPSETFSDSIDWVHLARLVAHFDSLDVAWTGEVPFEEFIARLSSQSDFHGQGTQQQAASAGAAAAPQPGRGQYGSPRASAQRLLYSAPSAQRQGRQGYQQAPQLPAGPPHLAPSSTATGGRVPYGSGAAAAGPSRPAYAWQGQAPSWVSHPLVARTSQLLDSLLQWLERIGKPQDLEALCMLASMRLSSRVRIVFLRQLLKWRSNNLL
ncbi:hypothetical protein WJX73_008274 [Symbiochloris irregularis]|uniref:Uncharacterized protein n=1 Tax=Symbiochloris irregularis TaxID=706552 RepID=A0AAW1NRN7_9CHLO